MNNKPIYLDNAATTPIAPEVIEVMAETMRTVHGNPSSIHQFGRQAKALIEKARRSIANSLNVSPAEIFFTSGGTEANNTAIHSSISHLGIRRVITSAIEHHAVLHPLKALEKSGAIQLDFVNIDSNGTLSFEHLEQLLAQANDQRGQNRFSCLVSLMHANNELSNLLPIKEASRLCRRYNAIFHTDMVQTIGHYKIDFSAIDVDFASCSAHKFHGPKGVGFLYANLQRITPSPLIHGGAQERNIRGGTENVYGIIGMAKALELMHKNMEINQQKVQQLKSYMVEKLLANFKNVNFLGDSREKGLYTILNVLFPNQENTDMLIMNLDIEGIAASSGSACSSGTNERSHVLDAIGLPPELYSIRFSFSYLNTNDEIDYCLGVLGKWVK